MNQIESYSLLFTDSLIGNLAINPSREFVIYSMKLLGGYNNSLILFTAFSASFISIIINYLLGKILKNILSNENNKKTAQFKIKSLGYLISKYYFIFLLFSVIPVLGKFIQVGAGFFNINSLRAILICSILKFIYYIIILII